MGWVVYLILAAINLCSGGNSFIEYDLARRYGRRNERVDNGKMRFEETKAILATSCPMALGAKFLTWPHFFEARRRDPDRQTDGPKDGPIDKLCVVLEISFT